MTAEDCDDDAGEWVGLECRFGEAIADSFWPWTARVAWGLLAIAAVLMIVW